MMLSSKQTVVAASMGLGIVTSLLMLYVGTSVGCGEWGRQFTDMGDRLLLLSQTLAVPAFFMTICIGRLASHRFFTPEDIDGDPHHPDTPLAIELQRVLQNTLEQSVLALLVYTIWAVSAPERWLLTLPLAAVLFAVGRMLFMAWHSKGAVGRALGFVLTFYPSLVLLLTEIIWLSLPTLLSFKGLTS